MNYLNSIGLSGLIKAFFVFFFYGLLLILYINIFYGLDSDLPDEIVKIMNGPISLYTFSLLTLIGLSWLFFVTTWWFKPLDFNAQRPKRIFWFPLPICEAAITLGIVIGSMFAGMSLMGGLLFYFDLTEVNIHTPFFGLFIMMILFTFPVIYLALAMLDKRDEIKLQLDVAMMIYIVITASLLVIGLPKAELTKIGGGFSILMIAFKFSYDKKNKLISKA